MGYDLSGLGMARPTIQHQRLARNLMLNYYLKKGFTPYEVIQERAIQDDQDGLVPDLSFLENGREILVLEIEKHTKKSIAFAKAKFLFDRYKIKEVFIYIYDKDKWYYYNARNNKQEDISYSTTLDFNFAENLYLNPSQPLQGINKPFTLV